MKMKKVLPFVLVIVLSFVLMVPVFAADTLTITVAAGGSSANPEITTFGSNTELRDTDASLNLPSIFLSFNQDNPNTFGADGAIIKFSSPVTGKADIVLSLYFPDEPNGADVTAYKLSYRSNDNAYQVLENMDIVKTINGQELNVTKVSIEVPVVQGDNTLSLMNSNLRSDGVNPNWRISVTQLDFTFSEGTASANPTTPGSSTTTPKTPSTGDASMLPMLSVALLSAVTMLKKRK
jgi:hypothetical protein